MNRRPYSTGSTAGLRFPAVPIDVAAANLTGDTNEDTVNGGYAWVLTASGTIYLVNINPQLRRIKAVVHNDQTQLFPSRRLRRAVRLQEQRSRRKIWSMKRRRTRTSRATAT